MRDLHPRWLSPEQAAAHLCVRPAALRRLLDAGRIPAPSLHLGPRMPRYDRHALDSAMLAGLGLAPDSMDADLAFNALAETLRSGRQGGAKAPR